MTFCVKLNYYFFHNCIAQFLKRVFYFFIYWKDHMMNEDDIKKFIFH